VCFLFKPLVLFWGSTSEVGWLDRQFAQASLILLIGLPLLFYVLFPVVLVLSGIAASISKHPVARRRARIVFGVHSTLLVFIVIPAIVISKS